MTHRRWAFLRGNTEGVLFVGKQLKLFGGVGDAIYKSVGFEKRHSRVVLSVSEKNKKIFC